MAQEMKMRTVAGRWGVTQRTIQIALGLFWILDAALQYQPRMWGHEFVSQMITPMAAGQPAPVAWVINTVAHLIRPDPGVWNFLFATLQLAIGVGLLVRRTVKPALVAMFAWALGVWWVGEGLGQLLTAHTSPLSGAPGAVLVYVLIGILVWPTSDRRGGDAGAGAERSGFETAAGARGPFGVRASLGIWAGLWGLFAVLWLLPANRLPTSIHDTLVGMAAGEPGWYAHFLRSLAGFHSGGTAWAFIFAAASLVIGLGPLFGRRVVGFFVAGALLELAFWVSGQALGGTLTGMGTDPNVGLLVGLLALAVVPTVVEVSEPATGAATIGRRLAAANPVATGAVAAALGAGLLLSSTYPEAAAASASGGSVMANMPGMQSASGAASPGTRSSTASAMPGMRMPAADALLAPEAMGGSDPSWHYRGPPLPAGEMSLLTSVSSTTDAGHQMQTPSCTAVPTSSQLEYGVRLVQQTSADVSQYADLAAARAAGYIPVTSPAYPVVHYVKIAYLQNQYVLDPNHVDSLVYATTPYGPVLAAAMYLMPSVNAPGPMPAGCMVQWHAHTNLCTSTTTHLIVGFTPCPAGTVHSRTPFMAHVWQVPVPGGPLTLDPSDLQTVEAAVMAQQCGEAPYDPSTPPPPPAPGECAAYYGTGAGGSAPEPPPGIALAP
jgi:hypothetical protein